MDRYDVIIIGTGAGGGTLSATWRRPASRSCFSSAATPPREKENWTPSRSHRDRYISDETWHDATASRSNRRCTTSSAERRSSTAPRLPVRPEDFGELQHLDGVSPAWPIGYDDFEPYYTKAESLYEVRGNHGENPTERPSSKPTLTRGFTSRASSSSRRPRARGDKHFHVPCGILFDEPSPPNSTCIRCAWCDGYPALCTQRRTRRDREYPDPGEPNVTLLVDAEVTRSRPGPGRSVSGVVVEGAARGGLRGRHRGGRRGPRTARSCWRRPTTDIRTGSRTARTRSGATSCSTTARRWSRSRRSATTPSSRRPSA